MKAAREARAAASARWLAPPPQRRGDSATSGCVEAAAGKKEGCARRAAARSRERSLRHGLRWIARGRPSRSLSARGGGPKSPSPPRTLVARSFAHSITAQRTALCVARATAARSSAAREREPLCASKAGGPLAAAAGASTGEQQRRTELSVLSVLTCGDAGRKVQRPHPARWEAAHTPPPQRMCAWPARWHAARTGMCAHKHQGHAHRCLAGPRSQMRRDRSAAGAAAGAAAEVAAAAGAATAASGGRTRLSRGTLLPTDRRAAGAAHAARTRLKRGPFLRAAQACSSGAHAPRDRVRAGNSEAAGRALEAAVRVAAAEVNAPEKPRRDAERRADASAPRRGADDGQSTAGGAHGRAADLAPRMPDPAPAPASAREQLAGGLQPPPRSAEPPRGGPAATGAHAQGEGRAGAGAHPARTQAPPTRRAPARAPRARLACRPRPRARAPRQRPRPAWGCG